MPNPSTEIAILIDTIEDLFWNPLINDYLDTLQSFVEKGFELLVYRKGRDEALTHIKSVGHFINFKHSFQHYLIK